MFPEINPYTIIVGRVWYWLKSFFQRFFYILFLFGIKISAFNFQELCKKKYVDIISNEEVKAKKRFKKTFVFLKHHENNISDQIHD